MKSGFPYVRIDVTRSCALPRANARKFVTEVCRLDRVISL
jgi:hypothetical protein